MRPPALIAWAVPAGLAAGLLAWFAAGGPGAPSAALEPVARQVAALRRPRSSLPDLKARDTGDLAAMPLLVLTTGPGATPEPIIQLAGVVRTRGRVAALVAVNDKPAGWLTRGETKDGVTLQAVLSSSVIVDTVYGTKEIALGDRSGPSAPEPIVSSPPSMTPTPPPAADPVPRGFRPPLPPASAPRPRS